MKDHLAFREGAPARDREQPADVLGREIREKQRLHGSSLCHLRDIRNVVRANDTKLDDSYPR